MTIGSGELNEKSYQKWGDSWVSVRSVQCQWPHSFCHPWIHSTALWQTVHTLQKPNCCFSKLFGYYCCMPILPMLINLENAVVVNYLAEVKFTQLQCKFGQNWELLY